MRAAEAAIATIRQESEAAIAALREELATLRDGGPKPCPEQWTCSACGALLGTLGPDRRLQIKAKDLYLYVSGDDAQVDTNCPKCATPNRIVHHGDRTTA